MGASNRLGKRFCELLCHFGSVVHSTIRHSARTHRRARHCGVWTFPNQTRPFKSGIRLATYPQRTTEGQFANRWSRAACRVTPHPDTLRRAKEEQERDSHSDGHRARRRTPGINRRRSESPFWSRTSHGRSTRARQACRGPAPRSRSALRAPAAHPRTRPRYATGQRNLSTQHGRPQRVLGHNRAA